MLTHTITSTVVDLPGDAFPPPPLNAVDVPCPTVPLSRRLDSFLTPSQRDMELTPSTLLYDLLLQAHHDP